MSFQCEGKAPNPCAYCTKRNYFCVYSVSLFHVAVYFNSILNRPPRRRGEHSAICPEQTTRQVGKLVVVYLRAFDDSILCGSCQSVAQDALSQKAVGPSIHQHHQLHSLFLLPDTRPRYQTQHLRRRRVCRLKWSLNDRRQIQSLFLAMW